MKHISIEGMDGVGKSTICKIIEENMQFKFVEKPWHHILDFFDNEEEKIKNYQILAKRINSIEDRNITSLFYALGSMIMYFYNKSENIVTDRHLCSNYAWSFDENNKDVYDLIVSKIQKPDLTVILYANEESIKKRIKNRNIKDKDINKVEKSEVIYNRMIEFCKKYNFNYLLIDTSNLTPKEIFEIIEKEFKNAN